MTPSSQPDGVARTIGGRHERVTDALIARYLRELSEGHPSGAAAPRRLDCSTTTATPRPATDPLADAELTA
jgi:hypothetical protein